ncbi:unnamed protein product [Schistosoma curassoni]|uniref:Tetraspanin n=1 Tax=Schistosoma curassoni TaxID=6186 RepID=A0A183JFM3_9TREM|nr:unnamed protein product [Schistosoma curassoni]
MCYISMRRILYFWLFTFFIFYGIITILLYIYKQKINLFMDTNNNQFIYSYYSLILTCLSLMNFILAIGTLNIGKCLFIILFLAISFIIFISELLFLIQLYHYRENKFFGYQMIENLIKNLVQFYNSNQMEHFILDYIQNYFQCCGYNEWHYEWYNITRQIIKKDTNQFIDYWVPNSCCKKMYQNDKYCGYAIYHILINNNDYFIKLLKSYQPIYIPNKWYIKLNNEPCPELIYIWLGEIPVYLIMFGLTVIVARLLYTIYIVLNFVKTNK